MRGPIIRQPGSQILTKTFGGSRQAANKLALITGGHKVDPDALLRVVITFPFHEVLVCVSHLGDQELGPNLTEGGVLDGEALVFE
jgi:hypothetical protein